MNMELEKVNISDLFPQLLPGAAVTAQISALAAITAFVLSFLIAFGNLSSWRVVRWLSTAYVEVFRGTSALVQLFYFFYILPVFGITLPPMTTGVLCLGLNLAAYGSEVVRGAIESISHGQREAGYALGLRPWQATWLIVIPQAMRIMWPSFGNLLVELVKTSSLVSLIALTDLTFAGVSLVITTGRIFEVWGSVLVLYFAMCFPLSLFASWLERRASRFRGARA